MNLNVCPAVSVIVVLAIVLKSGALENVRRRHIRHCNAVPALGSICPVTIIIANQSIVIVPAFWPYIWLDFFHPFLCAFLLIQNYSPASIKWFRNYEPVDGMNARFVAHVFILNKRLTVHNRNGIFS